MASQLEVITCKMEFIEFEGFIRIYFDGFFILFLVFNPQAVKAGEFSEEKNSTLLEVIT